MDYLKFKEKTNIFNEKTKLYEKTEDFLAFDQTNIPVYKIILSQLYMRYLKTCEQADKKPLSINKMKDLYGLPNNLNNYFDTTTDKPHSIHHENAYKLILILSMDIEIANLFLESLNHPRLDSKVASNQAKALYYALRCRYDIDQTNEFLSNNNIKTLF